MNPALAEFFTHYGTDLAIRMGEPEREAQREWVQRHLADRRWVDGSEPGAALGLVQSFWGGAPFRLPEPAEGLLLGGPVTETLDAGALLSLAHENLRPAGVVVGFWPCLRDHSPESQRFRDLARETLWPYATAEELLECVREAGFEVSQDSAFHPMPGFCQAVLDNALRFSGYRMIFDALEKEGYDPLEVGWGELRLAAKKV